MNKPEFVAKISENSGFTKQSVSEVLTATIDTAIEVLASGEEINLIGFGKFGTRVKAARKGFNPATGTAIELEEKIVPYFKASKVLKESVV